MRSKCVHYFKETLYLEPKKKKKNDLGAGGSLTIHNSLQKGFLK